MLDHGFQLGRELTELLLACYASFVCELSEDDEWVSSFLNEVIDHLNTLSVEPPSSYEKDLGSYFYTTHRKIKIDPSLIIRAGLDACNRIPSKLPFANTIQEARRRNLAIYVIADRLSNIASFIKDPRFRNDLIDQVVSRGR